MNTLQVKNATKIIQKHAVLKDIQLELESGNIYGFVGKNGSGKSMLFRMLSGLIRPTEGGIYINGQELYKDVHKIGKIGIVIENAGLYPDLNAFENLNYLAKINGSIKKEEILDAIQRVGLDSKDKRPMKKYSLGMKQKLIIAQAIMERPDFIFLDEPTNALDEKSTQVLRNIVKEEAERGAMILLSSHNPLDIEVLCHQVFFMEDGCIVHKRGC